MHDHKHVYRVIHHKDDVETVYLVSAHNEREAKTAVLDELYDRTHALHWTPEQKANDHFGLMSDTGQWSNAKLCEDNNCSVTAQPFEADPPYKLYSLNTRTGEMS